MKKLVVLIFTFFLLSSLSVFANNAVYHCKLDTSYKTKSSEEWKIKFINYTFTVKTNNTIEIYDHEIGLIYDDALKVLLDDSQLLIGLFRDSVTFETLVINKHKNRLGTYSISYLDGTRNGIYGMGKCNLQ